jgi:hypothetical protein
VQTGNTKEEAGSVSRPKDTVFAKEKREKKKG